MSRNFELSPNVGRTRRTVELSTGVVRARRAVDALDEIQDSHGRALGIGTHDETLMPTAFADLSDAICTTLGQIAALDIASARAMLASVVTAAHRRGVDGLESILLSAFLSAMRGGVTAEVGDAAALWLPPVRFPDRLAGGARLVPLVDADRLMIGSASASELAFAVTDSGGSATRLADSLRNLIEGGGAGDDPTLERVAVACADGFVATSTAGSILRAAHLDAALAAELADLVNPDPKTWQGPSSQLVSGKALALGVWSAGPGSAEEPAPLAPVPAGLTPRGRRVLSTMTTATAAASRKPPRPGPAHDPAARVGVGSGATAELHPPRALLPPQPQPAGALLPQPGRPRRRPRGGGRPAVSTPPTIDTAMVVPVGLHPAIDPVSDAVVNPVTGLPIPQPGPGLAEATLVEAKRLDVDVSRVTVDQFVDLLLGSG